MQAGSSDVAEEMSDASYPVLYMGYDGLYINRMNGYSDQMDCSFMRASFLPLDETRTVTVYADLYGEKVTSAFYEVRSIGGGRLIESTELPAFTGNSDSASVNFSLKDLIDRNTEYMLTIRLSTEKVSDILYYTRIIVDPDDLTKEKLDYVRSIHSMTFNKNSEESLSRYLESNSEGINTDLARVNIHSSYDQVTWGSLNPHIEGEENINILNSDGDTGIFSYDYVISTSEGRSRSYYLVNEYYRVRYTKDRSYLLSFERNMEQIYDPENPSITDDVAYLGITGPDVNYMVNDSGDDLAFVSAGSLYLVASSGNSLSEIFSFRNGDMADKRCMCPDHDIKILSVDESGGARFAVYGYMNRGLHEGECGIALYEYSPSTNTVSEIAFIKSDRPYEAISSDIMTLSYLNSREVFYFYMDGVVHAVDLRSMTDSVTVTGLRDNNYGVSASNLMLVWQNAGIYDSTKLNTMNFGSGRSDSIDAPPGDRILPLGFMGENLVYGLAHNSDIVLTTYEGQIFPMYRILIVDSNEKTLMTYEKEGFYVTAADIREDRIELTRVTKTGEGGSPEGDSSPADLSREETVSGGGSPDTSSHATPEYADALPDQIMSTSEEITISPLTFIAIDVYETIAELILPSGIDSGTIKKMSPKQVLFEGNRYIELSDEESISRFRVYGLKGLDSMYAEEAAAVNKAVSIAGNVIADDGGYIWEKTLLSSRNQIMKIKALEETDTDGSLNAVLDVMLSYAGTPVNSAAMTNKGSTPYEVLKKNLTDERVLNLTGCSMNTMLYYLDKDYPVLALTRGGAVLLTGFNESEVVLLDPAYLILSPGGGTLAKISKSTADSVLTDSGNIYITYTNKP